MVGNVSILIYSKYVSILFMNLFKIEREIFTDTQISSLFSASKCDNSFNIMQQLFGTKMRYLPTHQAIHD